MNDEDIKKLKKARRLINEVLRNHGDDGVETQDDGPGSGSGEPGGGGGGPGSEGGGG